jgi:hypothetical protein
LRQKIKRLLHKLRKAARTSSPSVTQENREERT